MCTAPLTPRSGSVLTSSVFLFTSTIFPTPSETSPSCTAGHALLAVKIFFLTRARLQDRATVVSGAAAGGPGGKAALGESSSLSPFYSVPVRALMHLTSMACKDAVSFVRRYRLPRTERDGSTAYSYALLAVNVASRTRARLQAIATVVGQSGRRAGRNSFTGESPSLSLTFFTNTACLHAVSFVRHYHIPRTERDDSTAHGHGIIAVNVASRTLTRLQGRPTIASGAAAGGRGGDLTERVGGVVCTHQRALPALKTRARAHARPLTPVWASNVFASLYSHPVHMRSLPSPPRRVVHSPLPHSPRDDSTAYGHGIITINEGESFVIREHVGGPERT
ncbi:uncharacterized protein LAESUDRAFT_762221 [Laetiporus sulphureus 93-53]|uniref:Uncharacterized protein n=1 Tax=Laetiporus sulphureus 93-53 TaxID=1314785 RepID=A0A165CQL0_9APHY|nr:uncharacterized protein LAESUDRAFT_762221 [Laetiporus sulphureus 93-53]KZT03243.1 hypothetical protein LAESUDRAFT_762221 [Laetiporus sulphureus 93-53]